MSRALSFDGSYIVTGLPMTALGTWLSILRNRTLQIRFHDPQSPGEVPSVFLEEVSPVVPQTLFNLPPEEAEKAAILRGL
jgi:hypothetical protein